MMARRCTAGSDISSVSLVVRRGTRRWDREVRYDAEVVARQHAVYRLVEDALAGDDLERGTVAATADHYVVDPAAKLQRPVVAAGHQRVARRERVTGNPRVGALPGVPVADARATQGLQPAPEAHASRVGGSVEVAGQDHVAHLPLAQQILYEARGRHSLQLALVLEAQLPQGVVVGEQQRSERDRCQDLRDRYFARVDAGGDVQGLLPHLPHFPAARDRKSRALGLAARLVGDVVARAEQVGDLVVPVGHHCLLEGDDVRLELAQAVNEGRPTLVPRPVPPPKVERGDAHLARSRYSLHCEPPESLSSARTRGLSIVARTEADSPQLPGTLLLKLFDRSEWAPFWGDTSRHNGARSVLIAALRYQRHAIQACPAIYQTVPLLTWVNKRRYDLNAALSSGSGGLRTCRDTSDLPPTPAQGLPAALSRAVGRRGGR